ncbi:hypothetical protein AVEN_115621-1 [Araneus ventricosus]|uniref:Uncharacterized protein n=1 Tax=Araneus ventricosus TaxID=182803 RepID=A0A4Y2GWQ8_ARAVE|nr:hypothetical protein AVEN_115621-1 [Araneus ventricosus]
MEQSSASIETFHISSDFTLHEDVNLRQNIVINLSFYCNSPISETSTSETTVSPEAVQPYPKALLRIMKRFRKRHASASLTSTPEKQRI